MLQLVRVHGGTDPHFGTADPPGLQPHVATLLASRLEVQHISQRWSCSHGQALRDGGVKPAAPVTALAHNRCCKCWSGGVSFQLVRALRGHREVPLTDHLEAICRARPVLWDRHLSSNVQTQSAQVQWKSGCLAHLSTLREVLLDNLAQTPEQLSVMSLSERPHGLWRDHSQHVVGPCLRTVQQQQPGCLDVCDHRDSVQQHVVFQWTRIPFQCEHDRRGRGRCPDVGTSNPLHRP